MLGGTLSMDKSIVTGGSSGSGGQEDTVMSIIYGVVIFSITCFILWQIRKKFKHFIVPVTGVSFSLGSCMMVAYGRADFGLGQALASRYTSYSLLLLASLLMIFAQLRSRGIRFTNLEPGLIVLIVASSIYGTLTEIQMLPHRHSYIQGWADRVRDYSYGSDLSNPHFTPEQVYVYAAKLDKMNLSLFRAERKITVSSWGPQTAVAGTNPNKQPDGSVGIWIQVSNTQRLRSAQVIFDEKPASNTSVQDNLITFAIRPEQLKTSGNKKIYIKQARTGRKIPVGVFVVTKVP
jgi:hypothetical protein